MAKLVPSGNQGQFVKDNQVMAVEEGFKNVNQSWLQKTLPLDKAIEKCNELEKECEDHRIKLKDFKAEVNSKGKFCLILKDKPYTFTDYAYGTASVRMPKKFNQTLARNLDEGECDEKDAQLLKAMWENAVRYDDGSTYLVRTRTNGTIRAILSDEYAIINNAWTLELFKEVIPEGRLSHARYDDPDTLYGNILIPDKFRKENGDDYGGMVSIGNSEIGKRKLSSTPGVFSAICFNGAIWDYTKGESVIAKRHRGKIDLDELRTMIITNLNEQIPLCDEVIEKFLATRSMKLESKLNMKSVLAQTVEDARFTNSESEKLLESYYVEKTERDSNKNSFFGLINSITRASQEFSSDREIMANSFAGGLIRGGEKSWEKIQARARQLSVADVDRILSL